MSWTGTSGWPKWRARAAAMLFAALLACSPGCGKKDRAGAPAPEDAAAPAGARLRAEWQALVDAERARTYERPPLFAPAQSGDAADAYRIAVTFDPSFELYDAAVKVLSGQLPWKEAPPELHAFARGEEARGVADAVLRGASRTNGKSIAAMRSDVMSVIVGSPAVVVMIVAYADAQAGETHRACRYLLALQRFVQDLARGAPLAASLVARTYQRSSLHLLRELAASETLSEKELGEVVAAYRVLVATQVPLEEALRVEFLFLAATELKRPLLPGDPETTRTANLQRLRQHLAAVDELRPLAAGSLSERIALFDRETCRVADTSEACKTMSRHIAEVTLRDAYFLATFVYLALALDRRSRGSTASDLDSLVPGIVAALPNDPVTGKPFGYVLADGKRVIRRGATAIDSAVDSEPRDIAAP